VQCKSTFTSVDHDASQFEEIRSGGSGGKTDQLLEKFTRVICLLLGNVEVVQETPLHLGQIEIKYCVVGGVCQQ